MPDDCSELIGFVTDAAIVGNGYPAFPADFLQPDRIGAVMREVIRVTLDAQPAGSKDFRKPFSQVAIGEENRGHAARS